MSRSNVAGIDLASAPEYGAKRYNRVGLAALAPDLALLRLEAGPYDDDRIAAFVAETEAEVVAIDAPLSLPAGRCCADDSCSCARFGRVRAVPAGRQGLDGLPADRRGLRPDGDQLDALTAAYMAHLYRQGRYWAMAAPGETPLIFPDPRAPGSKLVA